MPASFERPVVTQRNLAALLHGLVRNPCAPPEVLTRLATANADRTQLARRRDLPAQAAAILAGDEDATVRSELAANPNLPAEVQLRLAQDADAAVRRRLAEGAEYFTTVGVHGRHRPGPLSRQAYELLARDAEPKVRRALAANSHLPDDIRSRMLDDDDPRTAAIAAAEWNPVPTARITELLSRTTAGFGRHTLLSHLDGPLPADAARAMLTDIDSPAGGARNDELLHQIAQSADLDAELTDCFLADPRLRTAAAANPTLAPEHLAALARDPDNQVRAAVVARRGLDPVLRESVSVEYDDRASGNTVDWLLTDVLSEADQIAFARSRHQALRKTLAMRTDLSDEAVAILAADESFAVRLFVCEHQPDAPGWLLAQIAAGWKSYSRWDMLAHKNFPADAATALAHSGDPDDRAVAAAHPGLPAATIEALLVDDADYVRRQAASNPSVPADLLITLLETDESAAVAGAAANPTLPVAMMLRVLDHAGLRT